MTRLSVVPQWRIYGKCQCSGRQTLAILFCWLVLCRVLKLLKVTVSFFASEALMERTLWSRTQIRCSSSSCGAHRYRRRWRRSVRWGRKCGYVSKIMWYIRVN